MLIELQTAYHRTYFYYKNIQLTLIMVTAKFDQMYSLQSNTKTKAHLYRNNTRV